MTNQRRLRRAWSSLRGPKTPSLLEASGTSRTTGPYDPLEEPEPIWGSGGEEGAWQRVSPGQGVPQRGWGRRRKRGESLRVKRKAGQGASAEEEEEPASPGGVGEAATVGTAQPLGTGDDGQMLLLGETHGQAGSRMRKRKKQVSHVLQRGWQTFVAGVYSLTLSRPSSSPAPPVQPQGQGPGEGKEPLGPA